MFSVSAMKYRAGASEIRLLSLFLAAAFFIAASAASPASALTRDGDGFYLIAAVADLAEFRDAVNAGSTDISAKLTADIDLSVNGMPSDWTPIGDPVYRGTFDGGGHTVSGYVVTKAVSNGSVSRPIYYSGFFAKVGEDGSAAQIKNLVLRGDVSVSVDSYLRAGGLAGLVYGARSAETSLISNCTHIGNVYGETTHWEAAVGGLAGYNNGGLVSDCFHSGDVFTSEANLKNVQLGGFAGRNLHAEGIVNSGWQMGSGIGQNYASAGVCESNADVSEVSAGIAVRPIVTAMCVRADSQELNLNDEMLVTITTAPDKPQNAADYISNPQVIEDSYDDDIIEVNKKDDLTFSIIPLAAGETPVTFTAALRPTDFAKLPDFMPVSEGKGRQMSMTIDIKVSEAPALPVIRVEPQLAGMTSGEMLKLKAVYEDGKECDAPITWTSDDESSAIVDGGGIVTALSEGFVHITALTEDGRSTVCAITVSEALEIPEERRFPRLRRTFSQVQIHLSQACLRFPRRR